MRETRSFINFYSTVSLSRVTSQWRWRFLLIFDLPTDENTLDNVFYGRSYPVFSFHNPLFNSVEFFSLHCLSRESETNCSFQLTQLFVTL